jgi:hypothetical protein
MTSTRVLVRTFLDIHGPAPLGVIAEEIGLPLTDVRQHLETNSTRDDDGNFIDMYAFIYRDHEGHGVRHWYLTGKEQL